MSHGLARQSSCTINTRLPGAETRLVECVIAGNGAVQALEQVARCNTRVGAVESKRSLRVVALADRGTAPDQAEPDPDAVRIVVPRQAFPCIGTLCRTQAAE